MAHFSLGESSDLALTGEPDIYSPTPVAMMDIPAGSFLRTTILNCIEEWWMDRLKIPKVGFMMSVANYNC
jgi:hypothetical protein